MLGQPGGATQASRLPANTPKGDAPMHYSVRLEPIGIEMDVEEGETVLQAAFRQGIMLMHGCKEGQCASCKSILLSGDIDLLRYSTFALPEFERDQEYVLLCRTLAYSDLTVELLNYDEDILKLAIPVKSYAAQVSRIESLTHDIRLLQLQWNQPTPFKFWAGQYVDLTIDAQRVTRSFSMANTPGRSELMEFLIKVYPGGAFSTVLNTSLKVGDNITVTGPYGVCCLRENGDQPIILVGGGSGMAPLWSILNTLAENQINRPITFYYGVRTVHDLFYLDKIATLSAQLPHFQFIPALSEPSIQDNWDGETGYIHDVVAKTLPRFASDSLADAYVCGPPPLIDATIPILRMKGIDVDHIYFDKFFPAAT